LNGALGRWLFGKSFASLPKPVEADFGSVRGTKSLGLIKKAAKKGPLANKIGPKYLNLRPILKLAVKCVLD
jgi:hypothetical protein